MLVAILSLCVLGVAALLVAALDQRTPAAGKKPNLEPPPTSPPARICNDAAELTGPVSAPPGSVRVPAGDDASLDLDAPRTTYWFAPGKHLLGTGSFAQIIPSSYDTYVGAPGAVISGSGVSLHAFTQHATHVTIEYLTIEDFGPPGSNNDQGAVNSDSGSYWTITHSTIRDNAGAGVMLGTGDVVEYDCLTANGQYGFSSYTPSGPSDITISHDEISFNDTYNWEVEQPGCGCSGGGKLWDTDGATVTDDFVHDNHSVGIWVDTDDTGVEIADDYISDNFAEGVIYEISYNGLIADDTFVKNGFGKGPRNPSFPTGAVYISESGSSPQVRGPFGQSFEVTGNVFDDNWSGVVLWENSNRFCGNRSPDNAGTLCTLTDPSVATVSSCSSKHVDTAPLFTDCRWRTVNVSVTHNRFFFTRSGVGHGCSKSNGCGFNGLFSIYAVTEPYKGWVVDKNLSDAQDDHFSDNSYVGPWSFVAVDQGVVATPKQWTKGFVDTQDGSNIRFDPQDQGSTFKA